MAQDYLKNQGDLIRRLGQRRNIASLTADSSMAEMQMPDIAPQGGIFKK